MKIQRIICFRFKKEATEADRQKHMDELAALKTAVPQIKSYNGGRGLSGDWGTAPSYDTLHVMTFESMADVDEYFNHPAHQQFIEANKHIWDDALVLNATLDE